MTYSTIAQCAADQALIDRVSACVAQEGYTMDPTIYANAIIWQVASKHDIEAAYAYALATYDPSKPDPNPPPGENPTVITDQMILSAVQPLMPPGMLPNPEPKMEETNV